MHYPLLELRADAHPALLEYLERRYVVRQHLHVQALETASTSASAKVFNQQPANARTLVPIAHGEGGFARTGLQNAVARPVDD